MFVLIKFLDPIVLHPNSACPWVKWYPVFVVETTKSNTISWILKSQSGTKVLFSLNICRPPRGSFITPESGLEPRSIYSHSQLLPNFICRWPKVQLRNVASDQSKQIQKTYVKSALLSNEIIGSNENTGSEKQEPVFNPRIKTVF